MSILCSLPRFMGGGAMALAAAGIVLGGLSEPIRAQETVAPPPAPAPAASVDATNGPPPSAALRSDPVPTATPGGARLDDPLDRLHATISTRMADTVAWFDHFFGDPILNEENDRTRVEVGLGARFDTEDPVSFESKIKARLALPVMKERLHLVLDSMTETEDGATYDTLRAASRDAQTDTALRYIIKLGKTIRFNVDGGVDLGSPLEYFGKVRGRYTHTAERSELRLSEEVKWHTEDGVTEVTELRWNRRIGERMMFRSQSQVTWEEQAHGVTPGQSFSVFHEASDRRAVSLTVSGAWPATPDPTESLYTVEVGYRQRLWRHWLYAELTPGINFPQNQDYAPHPYVVVLFDVVFE